MSSSVNNYDAVSSYYDRLGHLVFAGALMRSQCYFLPLIPAGARVLLVGGGSGKLLEKMSDVHPSGLTLVYVEISEQMLASARKRNLRGNRVEFVQVSIEDYPLTERFDVVITPFLFDNFLPEKAHSVHQKLHDALAPGGCWLYTDFAYREHPPVWQYLLLRGMYAFFRKTAGVEAHGLTDPEPLFAASYEATARRTFYSGFMEAVVYRKK